MCREREYKTRIPLVSWVLGLSLLGLMKTDISPEQESCRGICPLNGKQRTKNSPYSGWMGLGPIFPFIAYHKKSSAGGISTGDEKHISETSFMGERWGTKLYIRESYERKP